MIEPQQQLDGKLIAQTATQLSTQGYSTAAMQIAQLVAEVNRLRQELQQLKEKERNDASQ